MEKRLSGEIKTKTANVTLWPHVVLQGKMQGLGLDMCRSFYWEKEMMVGREKVLNRSENRACLKEMSLQYKLKNGYSHHLLVS